MKVDNVETTEKVVSYKITLDMSKDELEYIWHRLNLDDTVVEEHYKVKEYLELLGNIDTYHIWEMFDKILYGE